MSSPISQDVTNNDKTIENLARLCGKKDVTLADDIVLPWPWKKGNVSASLAEIGTEIGKPWIAEKKHKVTLWLPQRVAFVSCGNH